MIRWTCNSEDCAAGDVAKAQLWLVDLAGSERLSRSEAVGQRLAEAQAINRSLSALGDCIHALATRAAHIPFRASKLTSVLAVRALRMAGRPTDQPVLIGYAGTKVVPLFCVIILLSHHAGVTCRPHEWPRGSTTFTPCWCHVSASRMAPGRHAAHNQTACAGLAERRLKDSDAGGGQPSRGRRG